MHTILRARRSWECHNCVCVCSFVDTAKHWRGGGSLRLLILLQRAEFNSVLTSSAPLFINRETSITKHFFSLSFKRVPHFSSVQGKAISFLRKERLKEKKKNPDLIIHRWRVNVNITIIFCDKLQLFRFWLHFDSSCAGLLIFALWLFHLYGARQKVTKICCTRILNSLLELRFYHQQILK